MDSLRETARWSARRRNIRCRIRLSALAGVILIIMKITKEMKIADVLKNYPSSKEVFQRHIPECLKCGGASAETIQRGAMMHGLDPDTFVEELNQAARPRKKK